MCTLAIISYERRCNPSYVVNTEAVARRHNVGRPAVADVGRDRSHPLRAYEGWTRGVTRGGKGQGGRGETEGESASFELASVMSRGWVYVSYSVTKGQRRFYFWVSICLFVPANLWKSGPILSILLLTNSWCRYLGYFYFRSPYYE